MAKSINASRSVTGLFIRGDYTNIIIASVMSVSMEKFPVYIGRKS